MRFLLLFILLCFTHIHLKAQSIITDTLPAIVRIQSADTLITSTQKANNLIIGNIKLEGNKRTRDYIILRELLFKSGDIIDSSELIIKLEQSRQFVFNTALFLTTNVAIQNIENGVANIIVSVKERWYFFPLPYFRIISRNFNEWWFTEKRNLDRVNYGLKFMQGNATGQNDELNVWLIDGYNTQINFRYTLPFFDKSLKRGFSVGYVYSTQKEINYASNLNKQVFYKSNDILRRFSRFDVLYSYRPDQRWRHYWRMSYTKEWLADSVLTLNPQYSPASVQNQQYFDAGYTVQYWNLDYNFYPSSGYSFEGSFYTRDFKKPLQLFVASARATWAKKLNEKWFFRQEASASIRFPNPNAFNSTRLLGFGSMQLRGLELYVAEGTAGAVVQNSLHFQAFKYILKNPFKSKTHDKIPFTFYLKAFNDWGYAYTNNVGNSRLNNKVLRTFGLGLDIVSLYDFVFRIEYSFNQLGDRSLFFQTRND